MKVLQSGDPCIQFCSPDEEGSKVCIGDFKGKWIILYFYPKDNTSGCTLEAIDFTQSLDAFKKKNAEVMGVSPDSSKSHCNFRDKHNLKIRLLSDTDHQVIEKFGCWVLKKMYGREYYGVERSTFLIDPLGKVAFIWRKVKVQGHVEDVLEKLNGLQTN